MSWQAPEPSPRCELWRIQWHIFNLSECLPLTLCQKTNHTPPRIEHTASDTLVLVVVPASPLLNASCAKLRNVNKGIDNNLCDGNILLPSWYWQIRWTGQKIECHSDKRVWVIAKYGMEYNNEKWAAIWTALNIYSVDWIQSLLKTLYTRCQWIYIAVSDPFGFSAHII